jgi:RHS repeat-associated protein
MRKCSFMKKIVTIAIGLLVILLLLTVTAFGVEKVLFYHTDPAGTPVAMTDANGNVVWRADYRPFGEEQTITGTIENNEKFVGKEKDKETGLYYFGARYMESRIGRFISPDPVGPVDERTGKINEKMLLNPQRLNRYAYGLNNPYKYVDPDGEAAIEIRHFLEARQQLLGWAPSWLQDILMPIDISIGPIAIESGGGKIVGKGVGKVDEAIKGSKLLWGTWDDYAKVIVNGREYAQIGKRLYTKHAIERMAPVGFGGRGIPPSVVEHAVQYGEKTQGKFGRTIHTFENVRVITEKDIVISVIKLGD